MKEAIILNTISGFLSPVIDFLVFCILTKMNLKDRKIIFFGILFVLITVLFIYIVPTRQSSNILLAIEEITFLIIYFLYFRKYSYQLIETVKSFV